MKVHAKKGCFLSEINWVMTRYAKNPVYEVTNDPERITCKLARCLAKRTKGGR